jgi:hypothetical protein
VYGCIGQLIYIASRGKNRMKIKNLAATPLLSGWRSCRVPLQCHDRQRLPDSSQPMRL